MLKVDKKIIKQLCWVCKGRKCKACHYTGKWEESIYFYTFKDKNGITYCIDSDNLA